MRTSASRRTPRAPCSVACMRAHSRGAVQTTELLAPYLPTEGRQVSPYSEGGALFALGLIHASHGQPVVEFMSNSLSNTHNEVVQHGACLGLGLASQGTDDPDLYEKLKGAPPAALRCLNRPGRPIAAMLNA